MHRLIPVLGLVCLALAAITTPASAGTATLGSPLTAPAAVTEAHPEDSAFWNEIVGAQPASIPVDGQIVSIRLKGTVTTHPDPAAPAPMNEVHFQTLEPLPDGTVRVRLSSAAFTVPVGGDPNTITEYKPENLCAKKGDFVGFNDEGGFDPTFYPEGVPFQVFGAVPNSRMARFTKHNSTNNGDILTPIFTDGRELLMQVVLAFGPDASVACGGQPLQAGPCANKATGSGSLLGTEAGDTLIGGDGIDVIQGLGEDDCLYGMGGADRMDGGAGLDKLFGGLGDDLLAGGIGADYLTGEAGNDRLSGGTGNERLSGGPGADNLSGGSGDDRLTGASGNDRLTGSSGRDSLSGGSGRDRLTGSSGRDSLSGSSGRDRLSGGAGGDRLTGSAGADRLSGGSGRDAISGGSGNDRITARDGARDRITCGSGRDRVTADRIDRVSRNCERVQRH